MGSYYLPEMLSPISISEEELFSVIKKLHPFKAAGSEGIPYFVLKCLGSPLVSFLKPIIHACIDFSYHLTAFCHCNTGPLYKLYKKDDSVLGAWPPIALYSDLGKVLENVVGCQILSLSGELGLLPTQHIKAHPSKYIDTVLHFLVQQIHAIWRNKDGEVTLLLLDMTGAYNSVVLAWWLHNIREKKFPECKLCTVQVVITHRAKRLLCWLFTTTSILNHYLNHNL